VRPSAILQMTEVTTAAVVPERERTLAEAHLCATEALKAALLQKVRSLSPEAFEQLVVRLLVKLKYGCRGEVTGKSGDAGLDGIIYEDLLGFSEIVVQAKRWENTVGRPEIQQFYGALAARSAKKGVFITTSTFSKEARNYVRGIDPKIVLIDGCQLAELMYDCNFGVTPIATYEVKRLNDDF
jgi:restriction system protein